MQPDTDLTQWIQKEALNLACLEDSLSDGAWLFVLHQGQTVWHAVSELPAHEARSVLDVLEKYLPSQHPVTLRAVLAAAWLPPRVPQGMLRHFGHGLQATWQGVWAWLNNRFSKNEACLAVRNSQGDTPLHTAVARGNTEVVRRYLASGASASARDAQGRLPLHRVVLAKGADEEGSSALQILHLLMAVSEVFKHVMQRDHEGCTPVMLALKHNKIRCLDILWFGLEYMPEIRKQCFSQPYKPPYRKSIPLQQWLASLEGTEASVAWLQEKMALQEVLVHHHVNPAFAGDDAAEEPEHVGIWPPTFQEHEVLGTAQAPTPHPQNSM